MWGLILFLFISMLLGNSGVWGLKKNFALLELLERLQYNHERAAHFYTADLLEKERQVSVL
jgi:tripartite motif-containing protein 23